MRPVFWIVLVVLAHSAIGQRPALIERTLAQRPEGAVQLLGKGTAATLWRDEKTRGPATWEVRDGVATISKRGSVMTAATTRDFRLHLEFQVNVAEGQPPANQGNSGVYIQRRYEIQIVDSFLRKPQPPTCGAIYRYKTVDRHVPREAGEWQSYDIVFRAPRWKGDKKSESARVTVAWNGHLVHDDVVVTRKTGAGRPEGPEDAPILLQDHGNPVRYRNIWIKRLDLSSPKTALAALPSIVPTDTLFKKVATGFGFTEGPALGPDGAIYFTDIPASRIHRHDPETGETALWLENTGRSNGLFFDNQGRLLACEGGRRRLVRRDAAESTVLAAQWDEVVLNSPNDLVLDGQGGTYFTDPRYGNRDDMAMDVEALYHVADGKVVRVAADMVRPNGLVLSLDARTLYVADNGTGAIVAYPVLAPGKLGRKRRFAVLDPKARGGGDGMAIDERGNIYCAGRGAIYCFSPTGQRLARIEVPESPTNLTFGGPGNRTMFVTARTSLYALRWNVRGGDGPRVALSLSRDGDVVVLRVGEWSYRVASGVDWKDILRERLSVWLAGHPRACLTLMVSADVPSEIRSGVLRLAADVEAARIAVIQSPPPK